MSPPASMFRRLMPQPFKPRSSTCSGIRRSHNGLEKTVVGSSKRITDVDQFAERFAAAIRSQVGSRPGLVDAYP